MLQALIGIGTPVVIVLFVIWVARARKDSGPAPVIRVALAVAAIWAGVSLVGGIITAVGGVAAQMLGDIAGSVAAAEVLHWTAGDRTVAAGIEDVLDAWAPKPGFIVSFPFWPLAAGLGFAALATVLRHGTVLQRDAEGLV